MRDVGREGVELTQTRRLVLREKGLDGGSGRDVLKVFLSGGT